MKTFTESSRDKIIAYLRDPENPDIDLTSKQKQLLDYYVDAYTIYRNYTNVSDTINILVKLSEKRGEKISSATARRYIYDALDVFGMASEIKREAARHLSGEIILDAIAIAKSQQDPKTMIAGAKEYAQLHGSNDPEAPNFDLLEPHLYEVLADPQAMKILTGLIAAGPVNLDNLTSNLMNAMAEDAIQIRADDSEN